MSDTGVVGELLTRRSDLIREMHVIEEQADAAEARVLDVERQLHEAGFTDYEGEIAG